MRAGNTFGEEDEMIKAVRVRITLKQGAWQIKNKQILRIPLLIAQLRHHFSSYAWLLVLL